MHLLLKHLERIPYVGFPLCCQLVAFTVAAGIPESPNLRVAEVLENDKGIVVRLQETRDGESLGSGFICLAKNPEPALILWNTGPGFIGGPVSNPNPGMIFILLIGLPTVILLFPVILSLRAMFLGLALGQRMNAQSAMTFITIRDQLDPAARELVRKALQNARRGVTVQNQSLGIRMAMEPNGHANF